MEPARAAIELERGAFAKALKERGQVCEWLGRVVDASLQLHEHLSHVTPCAEGVGLGVRGNEGATLAGKASWSLHRIMAWAHGLAPREGPLEGWNGGVGRRVEGVEEGSKGVGGGMEGDRLEVCGPRTVSTLQQHVLDRIQAGADEVFDLLFDATFE